MSYDRSRRGATGAPGVPSQERVATPGKHTLVETTHHAQAAVEGDGAPAAMPGPTPALASTGPQPTLAGPADGAVPTGAGIKVTVNTPHKAGAAISFDAKDYKELYKQVKARADSGKEAGSVSRGWSADYKTADDKVTQATYDIPLTMSLPAWTTKASQPQADQTKFDTWAASVRTHEDRHEQIYRTEYAKLKTAVVGPKEADCDTQSTAIDTNAEAEQTKFDAANQPAGLPIPGGMEKVQSSGLSADGAAGDEATASPAGPSAPVAE